MSSRRPARLVASPLMALCLLASGTAPVLLAGCGSSSTASTTPPHDVASAAPLVQQLAAGLQKGRVDAVPIASSTAAADAAAAQADLTTIMAGMDGLHPQVQPGTITYDAAASTASAVLHQTYLLGAGRFSFDSTAPLVWSNGAWKLTWTPALVHPQLTSTTRLRHTRTLPTRASILGWDATAIVEPRPVVRVGIDKWASGSKAATQAAALAALLHIDAKAYVAKVKAAGAAAFVEAETLRESDLTPAIQKAEGVSLVTATENLPPSRTFAAALLGGLGAPTAAQVSASHGDIQADDLVGTSGLEQRLDARLRGTVGHTIDIVPRSDSASASASPTPSTTPATPSPSSSDAGPAALATNLYNAAAVAPKPLQTTLDAALQTRAESALASTKGIASLVVLDRSTGGIRAAANSTGTNGAAVATTGRVAPGSTMKIADSLALLRQGYTPASTVTCPTAATVNGKRFTNDSWYPASATGTVTLATAVAQSCNTAFISLAGRISQAQQKSAAASLGMGTDHDTGFPSFFGSIPDTTDPVVHAANLIGQGQVTASPMAMAGVAASVGAGHTVIPWLLGKAPTSTASPLTANEASQLQTIMKGVVANGTARSLSGLVTGAKTGTAEYADGSATKTHAWMICYTATYAIAAMVYDGQTGAGTAGPIVKAFLKG